MAHDNSYGRGNYDLPVTLRNLGRYVEALKPSKLIDHKVFLDDGVHMLVADADRVSIMAEDLKSLLRHGLVRIQSNESGTLGFYFKGKR